MNQKKCPRCKKEKPLTLEFWRIYKNDFQSYCRECKKLNDRFYSRRYRKEHSDWKKKDNKRNLELQAQLIKEWREKYPKIGKAYSKFHFALRYRKIKRKVCQICGSLKSHGHHEDYDKPLEVIWLCALHHKAIHNPL